MPVTVGFGSTAIDEAVGGSSAKEALFNPDAASEAVPLMGPSFLNEEDTDGPVIPEGIEAMLRESSEHARALGNALRRLGQTIQPGMNVIFESNACVPSSP